MTIRASSMAPSTSAAEMHPDLIHITSLVCGDPRIAKKDRPTPTIRNEKRPLPIIKLTALGHSFSLEILNKDLTVAGS
jgi:hypothetical protein